MSIELYGARKKNTIYNFGKLSEHNSEKKVPLDKHFYYKQTAKVSWFDLSIHILSSQFGLKVASLKVLI